MSTKAGDVSRTNIDVYGQWKSTVLNKVNVDRVRYHNVNLLAVNEPQLLEMTRRLTLTMFCEKTVSYWY